MNVLELAAEMVAIPSVTENESAYVDWLEERLAGMGFTVSRQQVEPRRDNLVALRGQPRLLFCTHTDTVPPHFGPEIEGDRLTGRGACDTKGLTAAMLVAADRLIQQGVSDFGFLLVVGEEAGHHGAKATVELELKPERIILGEPTENTLGLANKGMLLATLSAGGVAAHSGYPQLGDSAIERLLDVLDRVRRYPWPVDETLGPTTVNIGRIEGGIAFNVVPPSARADLLFRLVGPMEPIEATLRELTNEVDVTVSGGNPPFQYQVPEGYPTSVVSYNTDGPYIAHMAPVTLAGPGSITVAHTDHEYIDRSELEAGVELYERLAREALER